MFGFLETSSSLTRLSLRRIGWCCLSGSLTVMLATLWSILIISFLLPDAVFSSKGAATVCVVRDSSGKLVDFFWGLIQFLWRKRWLFGMLLSYAERRRLLKVVVVIIIKGEYASIISWCKFDISAPLWDIVSILADIKSLASTLHVLFC